MKVMDQSRNRADPTNKLQEIEAYFSFPLTKKSISTWLSQQSCMQFFPNDFSLLLNQFSG